MSLRLEEVSCEIGGFSLKNLDLEIEPGGYFILLGPTGAGKSTLLKCILGLRPLTTGRIYLSGRDLTRLPVEKRQIGYLPQNCALFPHLDVRENILFGLRAARFTSQQLRDRLTFLIELLDLKPLLNRQPSSLSGGERQKIALARALSTRPRLLLLDEPFAAVDEGTKRKLWFELKQVFQQIPITVIHVTHNFEEAYAMGRKVGVMIAGRLRQIARVEELFERPASREIAEFLNYRNLFTGIPIKTGFDRYQLQCHNFSIFFRHSGDLDDQLTICVRPQDIKIINPAYPVKKELADNLYEAEIKNIARYPEQVSLLAKVVGSSGPDYDFELRFPGYILKRHQLAEGQRIRIALWQPNIIPLVD